VIAGNAQYAAGAYSVYGAGTDIWDKNDAFHFLHQPLTGDGAIVARVISLDNTQVSAKAGVMIRDTTAANSRHALVDSTPGNLVEFIRRTAAGGTSAQSATSNMTVPRWVRLVKTATATSGSYLFSAYQSADGVTWTAVGTPQTIAMGGTVRVGLAVTSHDTTKLAKGVFDHVNIATTLPVVTSATAATGTYGTPFVYRVTATGTPYLYAAGGLPDGLVLDGDTGIISGTPKAVGTFAITLTAYNAMGSATQAITLTVAKADATIRVTPYQTTYDGAAHAAAGTAIGVLGESLGGLDLSATTHTNAGAFADTWTFVDAAGHYNTATGTINDSIAQAKPTIAVSPYSVVYTGTPHGATGTVNGVLGETLAGLDLGATVHTAAGSYTDGWVFTDVTGNYLNDTGSVTDRISQALPTISVTPYRITYDGQAHTATGSATGVMGESLSGLDLSGTTHTAAGTYADAWHFTDAAGNYVSATDTVADIIKKADATISLAPLAQSYDGTPKTVSATTTPANLYVRVTYDGQETAPIYPGDHVVVATVEDTNYTGVASETLRITTTALVRHAPTLKGAVEGSLQVLSGESIAVNNGAMLSGDLLLPGLPVLQVHGSPTLAGVRSGLGAATPDDYAVTINQGAVLRYVVNRVDAVTLPTVALPPLPSGTRDVTLDRSTSVLGDPTTIGALTLTDKAGNVAIPAGTYGAVTVNGDATLVLGAADAAEPAVYNLQSLTVTGRGRVQVVGPVVINLPSGATFDGQAVIGAPSGRMTLNVASATVTSLNHTAVFYGSLVSPMGTIELNGAAAVHGTVVADRLILGSNALLEDVP
jgi:hypothetical protein